MKTKTQKMTKVLYIPTGELLWFSEKPQKGELPYIFKDKRFDRVTVFWEESDGAYFEKYSSVESFLKFVVSPLTTHSFAEFRKFNKLPDDIMFEQFEILC